MTPWSAARRVAATLGAGIADGLGLLASLWGPNPHQARFREWHRTDPEGLHLAMGLPGQSRCSWCREAAPTRRS